MLLEGKVLKDFNDKKDKLKPYKSNGKTKFRAEEERYRDLQERGFLEAGKEVTEKQDK